MTNETKNDCTAKIHFCNFKLWIFLCIPNNFKLDFYSNKQKMEYESWRDHFVEQKGKICIINGSFRLRYSRHKNVIFANVMFLWFPILPDIRHWSIEKKCTTLSKYLYVWMQWFFRVILPCIFIGCSYWKSHFFAIWFMDKPARKLCYAALLHIFSLIL